MDTLIGKTISNFRVEELIAQGGAGAVYKARDMTINRLVAVKRILPQYVKDKEFIRRFEAEAQTIAKLENPHVVPLYAFIKLDSDVYFVMRYLDGGSLRDIIKEQGKLSLIQSLRILKQISHALAAAHENQIIHRDLKPENILLDKRGNAYLSDFGIAKDLNHLENQTDADSILGTLAYLAPEQVQAEAVSPATDIYALALVTYELLTGQQPFSGSVLAIIEQHLSSPLPKLSLQRPDLPSNLDQVLETASAKDPLARYATSDAFIQALEACADGRVSEFNVASIVPETTYVLNEIQTKSNTDIRNMMIKAVYQFWILGILKQSLHNEKAIKIGIEKADELVEHPWNMVLQRIQSSEKTNYDNQSLIDAFEQLNGKMLILGMPGSGKTTSLLHLAEALLKRASRDASHPIPVVFNLASWGETKHALKSWLTQELHYRYFVPRKFAIEWVESNSLILLLDGLDEVAEHLRKQCLQAINDYRLEHGFTDIVITSRTEDYYRLNSQLLLNGAVIIQPLTNEQINDYLQSLKPVTNPIKEIIKADVGVRELARIPLFLNLMILTYQNTESVKELIRISDTDSQRNIILEKFVEHMYQRHVGNKPFSLHDCKRYLKWIAEKMRWHGNYIIAIGSIHRGWLPSNELIMLFNYLQVIISSILVILASLISLYLLLGQNGFVLALFWSISLLLAHFFSQARYFSDIDTFSPKVFKLRMFLTYVQWFPNFFIGALLAFGISLLNYSPFTSFGDFLTVLLATVLMGYAHAWCSEKGFLNIKHWILRVIFYFRGDIPLRMKELLTFANDLLYLRRVGDSFTFTHRYILDYFADSNLKKHR